MGARGCERGWARGGVGVGVAVCSDMQATMQPEIRSASDTKYRFKGAGCYTLAECAAGR